MRSTFTLMPDFGGRQRHLGHAGSVPFIFFLHLHELKPRLFFGGHLYPVKAIAVMSQHKNSTLENRWQKILR